MPTAASRTVGSIDGNIDYSAGPVGTISEGAYSRWDLYPPYTPTSTAIETVKANGFEPRANLLSVYRVAAGDIRP